ncbi:hypothetical protein [Salinigranum marinum]|uniref:hypothetical protein n=1 Tax=Salinigranum marinum TaxID=1515595 RepID=UPI002989C4B1|nr:hypothetical protein [Salinigranum marinum]
MTPNDTDFVRLAAVGAVVLALCASALTGAAAAQSDSPTITVSSTTVQPGERATVDVVLTSAPEGLAGYAVDLSVEGDGTAIEGASYPDAFGLTSEPAIGDDGKTVTLEAADLSENVQPGASAVVLATVELSGERVGETTLSLTPVQFDTDGGGSMSPASDAGTVTVAAAGTTATNDGTTVAADADAGAGSTASTADAETTSTTFALPAGGIALTALALTLVAAFVARRRR